MDLRDLSSTSTQLESVVQRRLSLSSLSSTSCYDSSTYNPALAPGHGLTVTTLHNSHIGTTIDANSMYAGPLEDTPRVSFIEDTVPSVATDVGPWVEQQKQQQSLNVAMLDMGQNQPGSSSLNSSTVNDVPSPHNIDNGNSGNGNDNDVDEDEADDANADDDLIPTAIVIKNIPFAIKKEQLLGTMTKLGLPLPYAFNYHFDNGVFRGLAFANFVSTDETSLVVNQLNGREIGGRKLRVEYKKMLPLQEREKIEREKREKRGQLEEQHRSGSNASLALLISVTSTTVATKNLSINGQTYPSQTERFFAQFPCVNHILSSPPAELNMNDPEVFELYSQLLTFRDDTSKLIFEIAFSSSLNITQRKILSILCTYLNLLELFDNGLTVIRRKPGQQSIQQYQQQTAAHLHPQHLSSASANAHVYVTATQSQGNSAQLASSMQNPVLKCQDTLTHGHSQHLSSMMNLSQLQTLFCPNNLTGGNVTRPELLRSHSQSALPLPRPRQHNSTPTHQQQQQQQQQQQLNQYLQYQHSGSQQQQPKGSVLKKYQNHGAFGASQITSASSSSQQHQQQQQVQMGTPTPSSAAALLRTSTNCSFLDVRSTAPLGQPFQASSATGSPTALHLANLYQQPSHYYVRAQNAHICQPSTPQPNDLSNRFAPFAQHPHHTGSTSSLQGSSSANEEYNLNEPLSSKFNNLSLNEGYEQQKGSGIWGPRK